MIIKIPINESIKRKSAIVSNRFSLFWFDVLIELKEKIHEKVSSTAMTEVNSSIRCVSVRLAMCSDVITKRQNPKRFADVFRICWDVWLAISGYFVSALLWAVKLTVYYCLQFIALSP